MNKTPNIPIGIDTTEYEKGVKKLKREQNSLAREMRNINKQMKYDPSNAKLQADYQSVINDRISKTADLVKRNKELQKVYQREASRGNKVAEAELRKVNIELSKGEKTLESLRSELVKTSNPTKYLNTELSKINKMLKFDPKNTELLKDKMNLLNKSVKETEQHYRNLLRTQSTMDKGFKSGSINREEYESYYKQLRNTKSHLAEVRGELDKLSKPSIRSSINSLGDSFDNIGTKIETVGKNLSTKIIAPLLSVTGLSVNVGMNFEESKSNVRALTNATLEDMQMIEDKARELGSKTKYSAKEVMDAVQKTSLAGWDLTETEKGLEGILNLATAGGLEIDTVADILTDTLAAFGKDSGSAEHFSDVIAKTMSSSNTDILMMGEALKYVASVMGTFKFSIEDTSLLIGLMANQGIKASQAGTTLRASLLRLASPTEEVSKSMSKFGISMVDEKGDMKELITIIEDLRKVFSKLNEQEQADLAKGLFGMESTTGMLAIMNATNEEFYKLNGLIKDSSGATQEMADIMKDNVKGRITEIKSALEELGIKVFDRMEKPINKGIDKVGEFIDKLQKLDDETISNITSTAKYAVTIPLAIVAIGKITKAVGGFIKILTRMNPLMLGVTTAISGLTYYYTKQNKAKRDLFNESYNSFKQEIKNLEEQRDLVRDTNKEFVDSAKSFDTHIDKYKELNQVIQTNKELRERSKLTEDEFLRANELLKILQDGYTLDPDKIKGYEDELEKLKDKSGLTREEFEKLVEVNDILIDNFDTAKKVTGEYGSSIVDLNEDLQELNSIKLDTALMDSLANLQEGLNETGEYVEEVTDLVELLDNKVSEKANLELVIDERESLKEFYTEQIKVHEKYKEDYLKIEKEIDDMKYLRKHNTDYSILTKDGRDNRATLNKEIERLEKLRDKNGGRDFIENELKQFKIRLSENEQVLKDSQRLLEQADKSIETTKEKMGEFNDLIKEVETNQNGVVRLFENISGEELIGENKLKAMEQVIKNYKDRISKANDDTEIKVLRDNLKRLETIYKSSTDTESTLQNLYTKGEDISKKRLELANLTKDELDKIALKYRESNVEAFKNKIIADDISKTLNSKDNKMETDLEFKTNLDKIQYDLDNLEGTIELDVFTKSDRSISKLFKGIKDYLKYTDVNLYKDGTNYHKGGLSIIGEEGAELVKKGNKIGIATLGMYDIPIGSQVIPHKETMNILRKNATSSLLNGNLNNKFSNVSNDVKVEISPTPIYLDGKLLSEIVYNDINVRMSKELEDTLKFNL